MMNIKIFSFYNVSFIKSRLQPQITRLLKKQTLKCDPYLRHVVINIDLIEDDTNRKIKRKGF